MKFLILSMLVAVAFAQLPTGGGDPKKTCEEIKKDVEEAKKDILAAVQACCDMQTGKQNASAKNVIDNAKKAAEKHQNLEKKLAKIVPPTACSGVMQTDNKKVLGVLKPFASSPDSDPIWKQICNSECKDGKMDESATSISHTTKLVLKGQDQLIKNAEKCTKGEQCTPSAELE